jgi:uncharacterized protein
LTENGRKPRDFTLPKFHRCYAGRKAARKIQLQVTGIIGLLISAKENGLKEKVSPLFEELREKGYWLSDEVIRISKKLAKE